jgi:hypothetical protein
VSPIDVPCWVDPAREFVSRGVFMEVRLIAGFGN